MANQQMMNFPASSSSTSIKKHDVFVSFRGEDTRRNFTSHLYNALAQKKIETYIDYRLEKGDEISPALMKAIEESHVSVVIFSEDYASSKWCLIEITKILECKKDHGQIVIPVFYEIDPSHVRKQIGTYHQAFQKHERDLKINNHTLQKWRDALTEASNFSGWDSRTYRTESEFIKDIVKDILQKLSLIYPIELKGVVGIEENYVGVESLLEIGSREVRIIGIWGMGGIGKTTLAIALHAKLSPQFEGYCFLANVREQSEKYGLDVLRNKLFSELLEENVHVDVPKVEFCFVMSRLRRKKVFIVLDDVATSEQLEDLISNIHDCLGAGSRVIVTTRDKHIFSHVDGIYEVKELNDHDSLELFCLNAFREKHPKNGYEELSESVITYCKGNPLALKVLGARLRSRSKEAWKSQLRKLQKIPDVKIHNVLKLTFDDLDRTQQDIFLDIACFLKGESRDHVISLLEACDFFPEIGIEVLLDKALITISNNDKIEMHDMIQEMGWKIVHEESIREPGRRSRLWDPDEVCDVLTYNKGTEAIEGLILDVSKIEDLHLRYNSFAKMTKMRFLKFYAGKWSTDRCHIYLPNGLQSLSDNLRYLQWHGYCLVSLPSTFSGKWLVELSMPYSNLEKLWDGVQDLVHLKEVDLRFSKNLVAVPDLSMATNLEGLSLLHCKSLRQVHPSILSLHKLKYLDLEGCTEIESLQTDIDLESLCDLRLSHCSNLKEFSVSSKNLVRLWLGGTAIQEFPSSIWRCKRLQLINLEGCVNLDSFGNQLSPDLGMGSLGVLVLSGCKQLNASNLCCILDRLLFLKWLNMEDCCNLQALPDSIGFLKSLESLKLSGSNVESLSANVKNLLKLRELWLDNCKKLVQLPELPPSLQILSALNCTSLETDFTQQLVLEKNISFSLKHGLKERPRFAFLPGAQISGRFSFFAEGTSITISHLPQSGLHGYILCLILSQSPPNGKYAYVKCVVDKDSERTGSKYTFPINQSLISDHVFLQYININKGEDNPFYREMQKSGVYDYCNISFKFNLHGDNGEWLTNRIKGCGVYPVYAFEHGYSSRHKGSVLELGGGSKDIVELQPRAIGFEVKGSKSNHDNDDNQTKKLQQVMNQNNITTGMQHQKEDLKGKSPYHHFTEHGCEGQPESFKDEDYLSSVPKNDIISSDTPSVSYIDSNQTIEVLEEKDLIDNQVNCFEPMFEKAHTFVEIDNQPLEPDWDPIAELESMLCDSYKLSAISTQSTTISKTEQGPNVATILQKLEMLLETSLEIISSDNEFKQQFHDVLKQLDQFEDQVPVRLHHVICKLKTFIEGVDVGFVAAQKTIQDYNQLLQSRSLLSKQLESAKARQDKINSNVSQGKMQFEKINSKIVELEQKLSDLVETRDKLKRALDDCDVEKSKLVFEVAQWVPECKTVTTALKKSETSYKMALTNKKKTEDEWANLKKSFEDNKI